MSIEKTSRIIDFLKERKKKVDLMIAERNRNKGVNNYRMHRYFYLKKNGLWVDKACGSCNRGMSKYLIDEQLAAGRTKETLICSQCSLREDKKALKELDR